MTKAAHVDHIKGLAIALGIGGALLGSLGATGIAYAEGGDSASATSPTKHTSAAGSSIHHATPSPHHGEPHDSSSNSPRNTAAATYTAKHSAPKGPHHDPSPDPPATPHSTGNTAQASTTSKPPEIKSLPVASQSASTAVTQSTAASATSPITPPAGTDVHVADVGVATARAIRIDPTGDPTPSDPGAVAFGLLALARREITAMRRTTAAGTTSTSITELAKPTVPSQTRVSSAAATVPADSKPNAGTTETMITPSAPLTYNGMPSLIHQIYAAVMGALMPIIAPIANVLLRYVRIPFFNDGVPPFFLTYGLKVQRSDFEGVQIWTLTPKSPTGKQVVILHGGGYLTEALTPQWATYADMARQTGATVIVPDYPLVPKGTAAQAVPEMADFLSSVIAEHGTENVSLLAESAGAGLGLAAVQEIVHRGNPTPNSIVLESPWLDATVSDPASNTINDPILNAQQLRDVGKEWAGSLGPSNPWASPINGSLDGLPPIYIYTSTRDLLSPEALRFKEKADQVGADVTLIYRAGLTHGWIAWPIFPEALAERPGIYRELGLVSSS